MSKSARSKNPVTIIRVAVALVALVALFLASVVVTAPASAQDGVGPAPAVNSQPIVVAGSLPEFTFFGTVFPSPPQTVGTFAFVVPVGDDITAATIAGQWGNSGASSSAPSQVFVDGVLVATCPIVMGATCRQPGVEAWAFTFSAADLANFADGSAVMTVVQTNPVATRLGPTTLTVTTSSGVVASNAVPYPGPFTNAPTPDLQKYGFGTGPAATTAAPASAAPVPVAAGVPPVAVGTETAQAPLATTGVTTDPLVGGAMLLIGVGAAALATTRRISRKL